MVKVFAADGNGREGNILKCEVLPTKLLSTLIYMYSYIFTYFILGQESVQQ